jgi:DNA-binding GntR family transcriptional regulator
MKKCLETSDLLQYSQPNWRFHDVVYCLCPNRPAVEMIMGIKNLLKRHNIKAILIQGRGEDSMEEHRKILIALERRDTEEAERRMRRHIANVRTVLGRHFDLLG